MNANLLALILGIVNHGPSLTVEGAQLYSDVAHGSGGIAKVKKALADVLAIVTEAAGAADDAKAATAAVAAPVAGAAT